MSNKVLSQTDIDALFGEEESAVPAKKKEVVNYDFKHPRLVSKEQMRSLRNLHEVFARNLSVAFTNTLRTMIDVQFLAIDQVVYSEFVQSIASPSALFLYTVEELGGEAVMEVDPRFCIYIVEKQTGGAGKEMAFRREMTPIEEKIMSRMMNRVYSELQVAWEPYMNLSIYQHSYESNPENIQIISALEPAIVVFLQVSVYDSKATLNLCYPYALLEEALSNSLFKYSNQQRKDYLTPEQRDFYQNHLKNAKVPLQAELGRTRISVRDLVSLQVGDALTLTRRVDEPMDVLINNKLKMKAFPGTLRKHRAIKVYDFIEENKENEK
jgi:flagellar motor switch protein FliM